LKTIYSAEVAVIGAGAVGLSIAYWLAKRGRDVVVLDREGPGAGSSTANFGLVWVHSKEPHTYFELSLRSSQLWPQMVEELGEDVELRHGQGGVQLCLTEADMVKAQMMLERQRRSLLFRGRLLSASEVLELQPGVSRHIAGGTWSPHDADVNPVKWTFALARGCQQRGVKLLTRTEVTGIELGEGSHVTGVLTPQGRIAATRVVNAAGVWADAIAEMVGVKLGLAPERGQLLVTERAPMTCPLPMAWHRQMPNGQYFLGTTFEDVGFDFSTTTAGAREILRRAVAALPAVRGLSIVRQFAGLRPMPKDGLPFLGPVSHVPGFYVAVGHSGNTLSPIHGKIISDLIVDGHTDVPIEDYDPLRYDPRGARKGREERYGH